MNRTPPKASWKKWFGNAWFRVLVPLISGGLSGFSINLMTSHIRADGTLDFGRAFLSLEFGLWLFSGLVLVVYEVLIVREYQGKIGLRLFHAAEPTLATNLQKLAENGDIETFTERIHTLQQAYDQVSNGVYNPPIGNPAPPPQPRLDERN